MYFVDNIVLSNKWESSYFKINFLFHFNFRTAQKTIYIVYTCIDLTFIIDVRLTISISMKHIYYANAWNALVTTNNKSASIQEGNCALQSAITYD